MAWWEQDDGTGDDTMLRLEIDVMFSRLTYHQKRALADTMEIIEDKAAIREHLQSMSPADRLERLKEYQRIYRAEHKAKHRAEALAWYHKTKKAKERVCETCGKVFTMPWGRLGSVWSTCEECKRRG
jgi:hypothetical protein